MQRRKDPKKVHPARTRLATREELEASKAGLCDALWRELLPKLPPGINTILVMHDPAAGRIVVNANACRCCTPLILRWLLACEEEADSDGPAPVVH